MTSHATGGASLRNLLAATNCEDCCREFGTVGVKRGSATRCERCDKRWIAAGRPAKPPRNVPPAGNYGYSPAYGTARGQLAEAS